MTEIYHFLIFLYFYFAFTYFVRTVPFPVVLGEEQLLKLWRFFSMSPDIFKATENEPK